MCGDCAFWEWGPIPVICGLPEDMRRPTEEADPITVSSCAEESGGAEEDEGNLLDDIKAKCTLVKSQLEGSDVKLDGDAFSSVVDDALGAYDDLYNRDCDPEEEKKKYHRMIKTLIVVYLSSEVLAQSYSEVEAPEDGDYTTDPEDPTQIVHRHDGPLITQKHVSLCFLDEDFIPADYQDAALAAVRLEAVEAFIKRKMSLLLAHRRIMRLAGNNVELALKILQIHIRIFHACTCKRKVYTSREGFKPISAHGYLWQDVHNLLYGNPKGDPPYFSEAVQTRLGTLYAICKIKPEHVPNPIRYQDQAVADAEGEGLISADQAEYLQSLPKMDHTGQALKTDATTPCELAVRNRVMAKMAELFDKMSETAARTGEAEVKKLKTIYKHVWPYIQKRKTQKEMSKFLDLLLTDLKSGRYWVETTATNGLFEFYKNKLVAGTDTDFALMSENTLKYKTGLKWSLIFPDCIEDSDDAFDGFCHHPEVLKKRVDGRQNSTNHYFNWRRDKDRYMYDYYIEAPVDFPNFSSFSFWPEAPIPNDTYGKHMAVWSNDVLNRSVIGVGDLHQPHRSFLLVIQDLLFPTKRKDGSEGVPQNGRYNTFEHILYHLERYHSRLNKPAVKHLRRFHLLREKMMSKEGDDDYEGEDYYKEPTVFSTIENLECAMFGPVKLSRDALALVICDHAKVREKAETGVRMVNKEIDNSEIADPLVERRNTKSWDCVTYKYHTVKVNGTRLINKAIYTKTDYGAKRDVIDILSNTDWEELT